MYSDSLSQVFPWVARVTQREAVEIAKMMVHSDQEPRAPEGSSLAVVSGGYPFLSAFDSRTNRRTRLVWLSDVSKKRLDNAWPNSTIKWYSTA